MGRRLLMIFILGCIPFLIFGQETDNPFDLKHRDHPALNKISPESENPFDIEKPQKEEPETLSPTTSNPFDLKRITPQKPGETTAIPPKSVRSSTKKKNSTNISTPINAKNRNFLFWAVLAMMVLITLLVTLYKSVINGIYRSFLNDNMLKLKHREQAGAIGIPYLILYLFFFFSAALFSYLLLQSRGVVMQNNMAMLSYCFLVIAGVFILKHLILKLLAYVFPISKTINQYNFTIVIFSIILGIILVPFNLVITYGPENLSSSLIFGAILVIILIYMFRYVRSLFIASSYVAFHKFHFFMYLCTVEIAPVLILVKIFFSQTGIQ